MQLDGVTLPDNMTWPDELDWEPVAQAVERTIPGNQIVDETALTGGRPITLRIPWVDRATVDQLQVLREQVATAMTLTLPGGAQHQVRWRRDGDQALEAEPHWPEAPDVIGPDSRYDVTLRLMEV